MLATPTPDPAPGLHGKAHADRIAFFPADVRDADTGEIIPGMQWRCVIHFTKAGMVKKQCVLIGSVTLHPTAPVAGL